MMMVKGTCQMIKTTPRCLPEPVWAKIGCTCPVGLSSCARVPLITTIFTLFYAYNHRKPSVHQGVQRIISPLLCVWKARGGWGRSLIPFMRPIRSEKNFLLTKNTFRQGRRLHRCVGQWLFYCFPNRRSKSCGGFGSWIPCVVTCIEHPA